MDENENKSLNEEQVEPQQFVNYVENDAENNGENDGWGNTDAPAEAPVTEEKKPKKKVGLILGIIFGSLALLIVAIILIFTLKDNKNLTRNKFIKEIGGVSETFIGAISQMTYGSADSAAEAFVNEEVVGDSYATIQSVNSKGVVDKKKHKIPEEFLEGSSSVEEVEVEFTVPAEASLKREVELISSTNEEKRAKVVVYVIKYEIDWKYFAPLPVTGDTISKSYYDSVFNSEKYRNCTYEFTQTTKSGTFGLSLAEYTLHQIYKFQDGKVYIEQTETTSALGEKTVKTLFFYAEELPNGDVRCYIQENGGRWEEAELRTIGFYKIEELTPFYDDEFLDYTYFTKTDYGFDLPKENAKIYFKESLAQSINDIDLNVDMDDVDVDMYAEYFVREGTLTGTRLNADIKMKVEQDGMKINMKVSVTGSTKVTNYGTTVVESPVK